MSKGNSSRDFNQDISESSKTTGRESSILQNVEGSDKDGVKTSVQVVPPGMEMEVDIQAALRDAQEAATHMRPLSGPAITAVSADQDAQEDLDAAEDSQDAYIKPLRIFNDMIGRIVDLDVHPYAKMALGVLSWSSKIILAQVDRDAAVLKLLEKLCEVYGFMTQDQMLGQISPVILGKISQQTLECARFIRDYSEISNFWNILGKNILSETTDAIQKYSNVFDSLMQNSRDHVTRDVVIHVLQTEEISDLSGMTYAEGAGLDTRKECLEGTRTEILSEITKWVNSTEDNAPHVLWISGPAGKGKSAIAHTIAKWFKDVGGLGSFYSFDREREADRRHEKIFSTIARDLADRDPEMRRALADAVLGASSLKKTTNIIQQWQKLLIEPLGKSTGSTGEPIMIVINALDESGGVETRKDFLQILAGKHHNPAFPKITDLPNNFRFIVTSRPLDDINAEFHGVQDVQQMSMDDIPRANAERDICAYVSKELEGLDFQGKEFAVLAEKADGLFEWARLACGYIKDSHAGVYPMERFQAVVSRNPAERIPLLHDMYRLILRDIIPEDTSPHSQKLRSTTLARFRSVMGQILGTVEPLPLASLNAMRCHFPQQEDHFDVQLIVKSMGSLLSGTTNPDSPIRPLHASFSDFLTDKPSSGEFFIDLSKTQHNLAFASLRVMEHGLRFNICGLKSSFLLNSEDPGLQNRVGKCIPPHLSYSSRYWTLHVRTTVFDKELAKEVKLFFDNERLFFWLESLALINVLSGAVPALLLIPQWLKGHSEFKDVSSTAMDVQRFIRVFGGIILHSTPHLYVSALPFLPANSPLSKHLARFPNTLRVASGRDMNWPIVQTVLRGHTSSVWSVSFSPDGTRIVTGSQDNTVRLWDAVTGEPVGGPLRGHTSAVTSVSFSPDGSHIVTCSHDETVRLWDAGTGEPVGEPLRGHTHFVTSVSFSPDGTRIVTGSQDNTARLWDGRTGEPVGKPLRGHTSSVTSVSFSPDGTRIVTDGTRIVTGSQDNTVRQWDAETGEPVGGPLRGHTSAVTSVSFSPDGTRIVTGSQDMTVCLWDAATGQPVGAPLRGHTSSVTSVSFSPDGTRIVTGSDDKTVRLWNAATGQPVGEPLQGHTSAVASVSFSPDGTRIVTGSKDNTVRLWNATAKQPLQQHAMSDPLSFSDEHRMTETTTTVTSNICNDNFICFSSNPTHALRNTSELTAGASHDDRISTPFFLKRYTGWVVGPKHQLLFWVPPASRHPFYSPQTALVIPRGGPELDLSRMAHGQHWQKCREE
ncbi:hypothetical protein CY34DRAFT_809670 [Suillus luteus UH-Slu-Lm8-n1]|uniref:Nephrocystin 3-like N-terminal domain-containing protein n=1 Tax=Suillus luteus UH-Slu-Lm8-n1 TaxID=930992 RepID=A0A0D0B2G1_9AGAM|nr:hypothetical protein CY34DRAFT_809670 [Suillus luteus UH-Slu-Lm8-n1]